MRSLLISVFLAIAIVTCALAFPGDISLQKELNRQARQEDEDEQPAQSTRNPLDFGTHVAQIITGAFTGNIDSIIKGSFGFIDDPNVNKLSHNTWETLKGNPTQTPPWETTTAQAKTETPVEPAAPQAEQPKVSSSLSAVPPQVEPASAGSGSSVQSLASPDLYYPGSSSYPTRPPARTTQPTYATLAPLSVIEGAGQTEPEPEEPSTTANTDDEDEAEGLSAETAEGAEASTKATPESKSTTAATEKNPETTTEDDDDQEQENFYSPF